MATPEIMDDASRRVRMVEVVKLESSNQPVRGREAAILGRERKCSRVKHPPRIVGSLGRAGGIGQRGLRFRKVITAPLSLSGHRFPDAAGSVEKIPAFGGLRG
jgi:hypothetical protein